MNGKLEQTHAGPRLRFERHLPHSPERVWAAITEPEHLAAWFPNGAFDGEITISEPPELLEFRWGTDTVRMELEPDGDGTKLTLLDTIDALGKAARDAAGWHACLDQLAAQLAGEPVPESMETWRAVHPGYVDAFGPEAATIGPPEGAV